MVASSKKIKYLLTISLLYSTLYTDSEGGHEMDKIRDYENYLIDTTGNVYRANGRENMKLSKGISASGYYTVHLCKEGHAKELFIHKVVADTYIPNPMGYRYVRHVNGDGLDNRVENLEWCKFRPYSKTRRVVMCDVNGEEMMSFSGVQSAGKWLRENVGAKTTACRNVTRCCVGQIDSYMGVKFKYSDDEPRDCSNEFTECSNERVIVSVTKGTYDKLTELYGDIGLDEYINKLIKEG